MSVRVGVDTGGTFTDLVAFDETAGTIRTGKCPSTPANPAAAIFDAFDAAGVELSDVATIDLGTTVATNALLERRGARVVYVGTEGFRDVPIIGRIDKKDPYDLSWQKPKPYVERGNCLEVRERVAHDGSVLHALDDEEIDRLADRIAERLGAIGEVDSALAVSLLFS
ncbi:MAG: hydantoinase/oxoprolinase family protein, partial [Actinobacteria bacterium]|nr:hydantoinase/oxoprolinase family protein [Actinomycetota bacterium]